MITIKNFVVTLLKKEPVLCIAALLAFLSMFVVPPSFDYIAYIDFRVLSLLFCFMIIIAGFDYIGFFHWLASKILPRLKTTRQLALVFVYLCFFSSMFITNDVALLTFVPFSIMVLNLTGQQDNLIFVIVQETIAANLGSMLTPIGNPQNLYLYAISGMGGAEFIKITAGPTFVAFLLLTAMGFRVKRIPLQENWSEQVFLRQQYKLILYLLLFLLSLVTVLHIIPYYITLVIVIIVVVAFDRKRFGEVNYGLLLTFLCFFLFIGNIGNITPIRNVLETFIEGREYGMAIILSQFISNVPATMLLSNFTNHYDALLLGVNIGGLGTLIASLASLISFQFYVATEQAKKRKYFIQFTSYNLIFLSIFLILHEIFLFLK